MTAPKGPIGRFVRQIAALARDTRGNYAVFFGLMLPVLIPGIGIGIDMARLMALKQDLQHSVDAASQTMTQRLNLCLDQTRTQSGAAGQTQDQDLGCLNSSQFTTNLKSSAQTLLSTNFAQRGYSTPPTIVGDVVIDQVSGHMQLQATVGYHCFFMRMLGGNLCNANAMSGANLTNAFAQGKVLRISVPATLTDLWAAENNQPNPAMLITASDGWEPYTFVAGSNLPTGLAITKISNTSAQIQGTPIDIPCDTSNCAPQNLAPVAVSVLDNGDDNRTHANRQTDVGYARFRMIHVLKITQVQGVVGEDGARDQTGTNIRPGVFTYGAEPVVSGGLGPFTFTCSGMPQGVGTNPFTCDPNTGRITGQPLLNASIASLTGTYTITVTDARGKTATGSMNYTYVIPGFTAYGGAISGVYGKQMSSSIVFGADGGYGYVKATCSGVPAGLSCAGNGYDGDPNGGSSRWGYFEGIVQGTPQDGTPATGVFYATLTDAAGRSQTVPVSWNFTRPTVVTDYDYFDCGTGVSIIGYVNAVYSSVHDKYGSNITGTVNVGCGLAVDPSGYSPNIYGPWGVVNGVSQQGPKYGNAQQVQIISPTQMQQFIDWANNICTQMAYDVNVTFAGRQGDACAGSVQIADVTQYGRFNPPPYVAPPQLCYRWRSQDGWGMTNSRAVTCTDQNGNTVGVYSW